MASTKEYLDFVLEQLSGLDEISSRAMMGSISCIIEGRCLAEYTVTRQDTSLLA